MANGDNSDYEVPRRGPEGNLLSSTERARLREGLPVEQMQQDQEKKDEEQDDESKTSRQQSQTASDSTTQSKNNDNGLNIEPITVPEQPEKKISRDRAQELLREERQLINEPGFSQQDVQRQQEIISQLEGTQFEGVSREEVLGPERTDVKTGITVEDVEQGTAQARQQKAQAKETKENVQSQIEFLRENPDIQNVEVDGKRIDRNQAIERLQQTEARAAEVEEELQTQIQQRRQQFQQQTIDEDARQAEAANQLSQRLINQARPSRRPDVQTVMETGPIQEFFQTPVDSLGEGIQTGGERILELGGTVQRGVSAGTEKAILFANQPRAFGVTPEKARPETGTAIFDTLPEKFEEQPETPEPGFVASGTGFITGAAIGEPIQGIGAITTGVGGFIQEPEQFVTEDVPTGAGLFAQQFREQPGRTIAEEGIGEISETTIGGLLAGPAGVAAGAIPTTTVEPGPSLLTGNLGTRPGETNIVQVPESQITESGQRQRIKQAQEFGISRREEDVKLTEEGGITRDVEIVTPEGVIVGRRTEEPVTRRQFVRENLPGAEDIELPDISFDLTNRRAGQFAPSQTETGSPDATPETPETGIEFGEDVTPSKLFGQEPVPETAGPGSVEFAVPTLEELEENQQTFEDEFGLDQSPDQQLPPIQQPEQEAVAELDFLLDQRADQVPEQRLDQIADQRLEGRPDSTFTPTPTPEFDLFGQEEQQAEDYGTSRDTERLPSIDAVLLGIETDENQPDEFTGFETRGLQDNGFF